MSDETKRKAILGKKLFGISSKNKYSLLEINVGTGGLDAEEWCKILLQMYFTVFKNLKIHHDIINVQKTPAGIKSAIVLVKDQWFNWLTEIGVHRLVRKSPFNAKNKRQTSFAKVQFSPLYEEQEVVINKNDLKIEYFRASGAGGQHVNTTESAVRITHVPTKITAQCQKEKSQHQNKSQAMKVLLSRLKVFQINEEKKSQYIEKGNINFGNQFRSYTFDPKFIIKDHRLNIKSTSQNLIKRGKIDLFLNSWHLLEKK